MEIILCVLIVINNITIIWIHVQTILVIFHFDIDTGHVIYVCVCQNSTFVSSYSNSIS